MIQIPFNTSAAKTIVMKLAVSLVAGTVLLLLMGSVNARAELRTLQSEDYFMEVWNTDSGLPDSTVTSL